MSTIKTHTFSNGFRIIYEKPKSTLPISSIYIFCDVGPVREEDGTRGVSHFIEHMCFKGTKKIPQSKAMSLEFDNVGARFNAHTAKRFTYYDIKCQDDYVLNCLKILSDMLMNSVFNKTEFEKEERVVMEENVRSNDNNITVLFDNLNSILYKGTPYEFPIDTTLFHKKRFDYSAVLQFYKQFYQPNQMILSVVTHIDFNDICRFIKTVELGKNKIKGHIVMSEPMRRAPIPYYETQYHLHNKHGLNVTYLTVAFRICDQYSSDRHTFQVLKNILSGRTSSRLFMLLREKHGLTYSSSIHTQFTETTGEFTIYTEMDPKFLLNSAKKKPGVLPLILGMISDLVKNGVASDEIEETKRYLRGAYLLQLEDNDTCTFHNGKELLLYNDPKSIVPYDEIYDVYYKNVTKKHIDNVIRTYFRKECMYICLVGDKLPSEKVIRQYSSLE